MRRCCGREGEPPSEVLLEGPAGCGKTRGVCELSHFIAERTPGARILWVRNTRVDLSESVLRTFEDLVLPADSPLLEANLKRSHRDAYEYPNGSRIILGGMNNPHKFRSAEFDLICFFEASEGDANDYEMLLHRLRAGNLRRKDGRVWHLILADTNPDAESHWLNQRANAGRMERFCVQHEDNPYLFSADGKPTPAGAEYIARLDTLTGVRKLRYRYGKWCAAEGAIWPEFSRAKHVIHELKAPLKWAFGGVDWGYRAPGCVHVYGVDSVGRVTLLREVYQRGWSVNAPEGDDPINPKRPSWVSRVKRLIQEVERDFQVRPEVFVCDNAEPRSIDDFRAAGINARECIKETAASFDAVRKLLKDDQLYFLSDANREIDPELVADPTIRCGSVLHEIDSYVYADLADGKPVKEEPHPKCVDHGCDVLRYCCLWMERKDLTETPRRKAGPAHNWAQYFDVEGELERQRQRERGWEN